MQPKRRTAFEIITHTHDPDQTKPNRSDPIRSISIRASTISPISHIQYTISTIHDSVSAVAAVAVAVALAVAVESAAWKLCL